jgi:hypothetical protein
MHYRRGRKEFAYELTKIDVLSLCCTDQLLLNARGRREHQQIERSHWTNVVRW